MLKLTIQQKQESQPLKQKQRAAKLLHLLLILSLMNLQKAVAQLEGTSSGGTIIFGSSPLQGLDGNSQLRDANWGVLPSRQNQTDLWGRTTSNNSRTQQQARQRTQARDLQGNPVLTDRNGNVLYDAQGQAIVDSIALNGGGGMYDPSLDPATITPPPDDPNDVPIDGGVTILLMIATGVGYRNRKGINVVTI